MKRTVFVLLFAFASVIGFITAFIWMQTPTPARKMLLGVGPPGPATFDPIDAVARPPLVTGWKVLTVQQSQGVLEDDERVLAVEIDGEARAWPLNVMTGPDREVFNDTLGGRAIAATW